MELDLEFTHIRAPVSGLISRRSVTKGQIVSAGSELFRIVRDSRLELDAEIPETDLATVKAGMPARVYSDKVGEMTGRVRLVTSEVNPTSRLGTARIALSTMGGFRPGMFARATIDAFEPPQRYEERGEVDGHDEFDFLAGEWRIRHRRLTSTATGEWDEFDGEATCWTILGGVGSVEELRIPARDFSGMGLRLLDRETRVWSDFWVNAKSGVLGAAGLTGGFVDGAGVYTAEDTDDGKPIVVRGVWDEITPTSCRWRQGSSRDGGATWDDHWIMHWSRA